jgi:transcriptional regulator with XRE-family HTH domain
MSSARTSTLAQEVGRRIQALRADRGISLSELARGASLGKATLSAVESGTRNATLETLYAIAARLDVPLAALLAPPTPSAPTAVHGTAVTAELLEVFTDEAATTELYRLTIHPGPTQTSPAHPTGVVEYLTVFSGTALVGPQSAPITVPAGSHVSFASDVPHIYAALDAEVRASLVIRHPARRQSERPLQA